MFNRKAKNIFTSSEFGRQMRFIAGPRQVGKTTLAKRYLAEVNCLNFYYNWDYKATRDRFRQNREFYLEDIYNRNKKLKDVWICFDEIHKIKKWKNILKEHFDKTENKIKTLVTGSARLDLFRKSGDSLAGRYFLFHLLPVSLGEITNDKSDYKDIGLSAKKFIENRLDNYENKILEFEQLFNFSGFPEPLSKARKSFHNKWLDNYIERIIYEDIRDLTRIQELDKVEDLIEILPERIGSLLSINSLSEILEVNFRTTRNYLRALELGYFIFFLKPYKKSISRALKKEQKVYFFDWTRITSLPKRFENFVACELKNLITLFNDAGLGKAEQFFIRTKDGKETDFLITIDKKPWLLVEAKIKADKIEKYYFNQANSLGNIPVLQLTYEHNIIRKYSNNSYIISASRFF